MTATRASALRPVAGPTGSGPGAAIELRAGSVALVIDPERGGRLSSLVVDGQELLVQRRDGSTHPVRWGCFLMAPWPGRLRSGVLDWDGTPHQLRRTFGRNAIHGVVVDRPWTVDGVDGAQAELSRRLDPADWPPGGLVRQAIALDPDGVTLTAEVLAERAMPAGLGWHPWFRRLAGDVRMRVDAAETLETRELIPTGRRLAVDRVTDLRRAPLLGRRRLDNTYIDVVSPALIRWPRLELEIGFAPPLSVVVVYTPPAAICVEPQTAWPNALGADLRDAPGTGLVRLGAGDSLRATTRFAWRRVEP